MCYPKQTSAGFYEGRAQIIFNKSWIKGYVKDDRTNKATLQKNPAYLPSWRVNNSSFGEFGFAMIGRADKQQCYELFC